MQTHNAGPNRPTLCIKIPRALASLASMTTPEGISTTAQPSCRVFTRRVDQKTQDGLHNGTANKNTRPTTDKPQDAAFWLPAGVLTMPRNPAANTPLPKLVKLSVVSLKGLSGVVVKPPHGPAQKASRARQKTMQGKYQKQDPAGGDDGPFRDARRQDAASQDRDGCTATMSHNAAQSHANRRPGCG